MNEKAGTLHRPISPSSSLLLDIIRSGSAVVVLVGHLSQPSFSPGRRDLTKAATAAVVVFFLLSGFVIRYVTVRKPIPSVHYYVDRASRVYSVAIPAILLTLILDPISHALNRTLYENWIGNCDHLPLRILANLTFTSEIWTQKIYLLSNSPFWSLSFECVYYVLYGLAFYLTGIKRIVLLVFVSLLVGPGILALFPLWLGGCLLYSLYQQLRGQKSIVLGMATTFTAVGLSLTVFHREVIPHLRAFQASIDQIFPNHKLLGRASIHFYETGSVAFMLMLFLLLSADMVSIPGKSRLANAIHFVAEGTFPLYLFHFPILVFIFSLTGTSNSSLGLRAVILIGVVIFAVLMGHPCNLLKVSMRAWLFDVLQLT
ncbi:MAG: putative acyltransferase [Edaphobacter sp.]|nr:putative acyltransferase [Edaphobacter sp.]